MEELSIYVLFAIAALVVSVLAASLLRASIKNTRYLPLLVFVIIAVVEMLSRISLLEGFAVRFPHLFYVSEPLIMLNAPLIYIYTRNLLSPKLELKKSDALFLIPFVLSVLAYIPFYSLSAEQKIADFMQFGGLNTDISENIWEWNFEVCWGAVFLVASLKQLAEFNLKIRQQFSDVHNASLHLTQWFIKFCLITYCLELTVVYATLYGWGDHKTLFYFLNGFNAVVLLLVGVDAVFSSKYVDALEKNWQAVPQEEKELAQSKKYVSSTLDQDQSRKIKQAIEQYMLDQKPYLNAQFRLGDLAEAMEISSHQISQVLNESVNKNFNEFVNQYRINEAVRLLQDQSYSHLTLSAIGFEAGFNSKSSFYSAFKKVTGKTPSEFKSL
ncbi:helix-turn-helix domain-containing protein [Aureibacter tunicatorum]|uniref:AraC-like DNA-binding protein n=1 Tax=Aureibacter tunicatorum TaxID=866807 RepID=A0AAE3XJJ6_9BACT|nr:helix-turn-helix domain-containing protein [Aureibacter tunicatorum]MDR6237562.1 AraC-like DNA-binding protein [Aureibacter tunicatorum]BDD02596.1 hypothetical protein AUTU_00790 [Aureibacter tunicatorum]